MVEQSATVSKLFAALVAAQAEMRNPPKDSVNPHFKSRFADLATVLDTVKPVLAKFKLGVVQLPCEVDGVGPALSTMLIHESGEYVRSTIGLRPIKADPQSTGAALTYARRYGLQAVLGITADDDDDGNDGNHASRAPQQRQQPALTHPPQQRPPLPQHPVTSVATAVPLWEDDDAFFDRLSKSKREWPKVVAWLNDKHGGKYKPDAGFWDVAPEHRRIAAEAITK
jgi:hypothetical protein